MGEGGERTLSDEGMVAAPPDEAPGSVVITPALGLLPPQTPLTMEQFCALAAVPIEHWSAATGEWFSSPTA